MVLQQVKVLGQFIKPFLSDKDTHRSENYWLLGNDQIIEVERKISEIFNNHYVNIIENITDRKQEGS